MYLIFSLSSTKLATKSQTLNHDLESDFIKHITVMAVKIMRLKQYTLQCRRQLYYNLRRKNCKLLVRFQTCKPILFKTRNAIHFLPAIKLDTMQFFAVKDKFIWHGSCEAGYPVDVTCCNWLHNDAKSRRLRKEGCYICCFLSNLLRNGIINYFALQIAEKIASCNTALKQHAMQIMLMTG